MVVQNEGQFYKKPTFIIALIVVALFLAFGISDNYLEPILVEVEEGVFEERGRFEYSMDFLFNNMIEYLGWTFILGASVFLFLIIFLLLSPVGEIKLGADDETPAYSNLPWFAMLFSCGMGIGLLFWGVSEPVWHYIWPPYGEAYSEAAIHIAMRYSFFHWGFHPWAIYAVVAGSLAYFSYRKGLPMLLSSCLEPLIGRKGIEGPIGTIVNVIGVFATLFGLATSLGLGTMQLAAGLESIFGLTSGPFLWGIIVIVVGAVALISTSTGIDRGIKYLSQVNIVVASLLMLLVFLVGPTLFIFNIFTHSTGDYIQNIIGMSFRIDAAGEGTAGWAGAWTIFYWAWWIAWAPFVGTFIARISRGRTIRNFVVGVMLVPVFVSLVWFSVFGGAALYTEHFGAGGIESQVAADSALGFFALLSALPPIFGLNLSTLLIVVAMFSVAVFFITSSDSGTYVNGMLTSGGDPNPVLPLRIIWGVAQIGIAFILLRTEGLASLQTASIVGGFPFMLVMLLMLYCFMKALYAELNEGTLPLERKRIRDALDEIKAGK